MRRTLTRWCCLGSALISFSAAALAGPAPVAPVPADAHPLRFVPNQRQWEQPILFAADVPAGRLFLERGRLLVARYDAPAVERAHHAPAGRTERIGGHAYSVRFVGANARPEVRGEQPTGEHLNYFLGNDESRWATNVPAYTDVRYRQLYPGTDLRFYSRGPVMEYDFELAAGADAGRIRLQYDGQESLTVVDGALHIGTSVGRVTEQKPFAYQMIDGRRVAVPCQYVLGPRHTVRFGLPNGYDHTKPLVIDPVLVYSTYSGATANLNWGYTACPDTAGNLYAASINFSAGYPTTVGAYDPNFNGGDTDIVISKYNPRAPTGTSSLVYATYLGGTGSNQAKEYPHSLVTNAAGELVLLGSTDASNYPTTATAYDRSLGGTTDLVVTRLSAGGNQLLASTYVGGTGIDGRMDQGVALYQNFGDDLRGDVVLDATGNVYFASVTQSTNYPSTGGFQTSRQGSHDAVVTKLNPGLTGVVWSTYLGGTGVESGYSIQLDSLNGVFVAGGTTSTNFPRTAGGLNATARGGLADGFVAHISPDGTQLLQSTYLGTSAYDQAYFLQLGRQGSVYVLGQTSGAYPVTAGVYRNANSRQFIHRLNYQLTSTLFSTVIGSGSGGTVPNISPTAFLVDNCGQILLSGWGAANVAGLPTTPDALLATAPNYRVTGTSLSNDNIDNTFGYLYLMQLSPGARRLVYGTYFGTGTTHVDGGTSRFDKRGIIYQAICVRQTQSGQRAPAILTTPNAFARTQTSSNQTSSAAFKMDIARLDASFVPAANSVPNTRSGCAPLTVVFSRATPGNNGTSWNFGNGQTSTQPNNVSVTYTAPGRYAVTLTAYDSTSCRPAVVGRDTVTVFGVPANLLGPGATVCPGASATLTAADAGTGATYTWSPTTGLSSATGRTVTANPAATTTYTVRVTTAAGCTGSASTNVTRAVVPTILLHATPRQPVDGEPVTFADTLQSVLPLSNRRWDFGDGQTGTGLTPTHTYAAPGTYTVRLSADVTATGCPLTATLTLVVGPSRAFKLPNVITPNGDTQNEDFRPYVTREPVSVQIFNRWGRKVFEQDNYTQGWGRGTDVAAGMYYFQLRSASGQTWKGWLEVVK